jgi:hypothetical protein
MGNIIFWQWVNQTYNAMFNYANRNTSNANSTEDIGKAYVSAVGVSIAAGVGLNQAVKRVRGLPPAVLGLANIMVPFVAVASGDHQISQCYVFITSSMTHNSCLCMYIISAFISMGSWSV